VFEDLRRYPKLVGGITPSSELKAVRFYEDVLDFDPRPDLKRTNGVWPMGSAEASEFAKLAETTYRDVNIGLANQFAKHAHQLGVDIYQIIQGCNSQPFSHIHQPGIAVGGHCIPIYPQMYLLGDRDATIVRAAREQNSMMPRYAAERVLESLGTVEGLNVVILGLAYRGNVKEHAFSGTFDLVDEFRSQGARVSVNDPLYTADEIQKLGLAVYELGQPADVVVLQANHTEYMEVGSQDFPGVSAVLDGRASLKQSNFPGVTFIQIGNSPT
jgi:nucleotide sugar dehydrogenase